MMALQMRNGKWVEVAADEHDERAVPSEAYRKWITNHPSIELEGDNIELDSEKIAESALENATRKWALEEAEKAYHKWKDGGWVPADGKEYYMVKEEFEKKRPFVLQGEKFDHIGFDMGVDSTIGKTGKDERTQAEVLAGTDDDGVYRMPGQDEDGTINGRFL